MRGRAGQRPKRHPGTGPSGPRPPRLDRPRSRRLGECRRDRRRDDRERRRRSSARPDVDVRATTLDQADIRLEEAIRQARAHVDGTRLTISGGFNRPPMERTEAVGQLFERAPGRSVGASGLELGEGSTGGGSDGNFTAALGLPTLDGLGIAGSGAHASHEQIELDSLPRADGPARLAADAPLGGVDPTEGRRLHDRGRHHDPARPRRSPTTWPASRPSDGPGGSPTIATSCPWPRWSAPSFTAAWCWGRSRRRARRWGSRSPSWARSKGALASTRSSPASSPGSRGKGLGGRLKSPSANSPASKGSIAWPGPSTRSRPATPGSTSERLGATSTIRRGYVRPTLRRPQRQRHDRPPDRRVVDPRTMRSRPAIIDPDRPPSPDRGRGSPDRPGRRPAIGASPRSWRSPPTSPRSGRIDPDLAEAWSLAVRTAFQGRLRRRLSGRRLREFRDGERCSGYLLHKN